MAISVSMTPDTGNEYFWQWDLNRSISVVGDVTEIHYVQPDGETALVVEVSNGFASVPNELLQESGTLLVYAFTEDHTLINDGWRIRKRQKPDDYIYTPTEIRSWETIEAEAANAILIAQAVRDDFDTLSSTTESVRTDAEAARDEAVAAKTDVENLKDSIYYTLISPPVSAINEAIVLDCGTAAILGG